MSTQPPAAAGRSRFWRRLLVLGRWVAEREKLPRKDDQPKAQRIEASRLTWLTSPDQLPDLLRSGHVRRGLIPWLASRDRLPSCSESLRTERGFLAWVTAREDLATTSSEKVPASRSFLHWLLAAQPHERLESLHPAKEVPPHES